MRRVIVLSLLLVLSALLAFAGLTGRGREPQGPPVAEIQKVKDNLYMITGGGGNTAVLVTDAGVVVVDTKFAGWGQAILEKIKTVTNKPVTTIINTHTHADHVGSNEFFGPKVEVVAQENTKANMEKLNVFKGDKAAFLPKKTYKDKLTLGKGKDEIDLYYFGPAHTNGDAWVVFKSLRVMHAGDAFAFKIIPMIDRNNGGSGVQYGKTLAKAATSLKDIDTIITGHSTLMTPTDLKEYADFNNDFLDWAQAEMKAGKSVDAAAAEYSIPDKYKSKGYTAVLPTPTSPTDFARTYPQGVGVKANLQIIYDEMKR